MDHTRYRASKGPHTATMLTLSVIVLGVFVSIAAFFAKEDRADIKARADHAHTLSQANDREIALLKQSLQQVQGDLSELKAGQRLILQRYGIQPPVPVVQP